MKKTIFIALFALVLSVWDLPCMAAEGEISAKAAIVYEPTTGTVLYEKSADEPMLIASTTKIMTAMVVIENCGLEEKVDVTMAHANTEGSSMYLRPGGDYTVKDLLYGLMLASGNDAAAALAEHTAGSMEAFAELMNSKSRSLGLQNTHFVNSHGLDAEGQYSSARDLALITAEAMKNDFFSEVFATSHYNVNGVDYYNHNKLLSTCPGCIGGKTGYTEKAGRILVSCVEREGMCLICVTISDPKDWEDHEKLYDKCFAESEFIPVLAKSEALELASGQGKVGLECEKEAVVVTGGENVLVRLHLPRFVFPPVSAGDIAGFAELFIGNEPAQKLGIYYAQNVSAEGGVYLRPWDRAKNCVIRFGD